MFFNMILHIEWNYTIFNASSNSFKYLIYCLLIDRVYVRVCLCLHILSIFYLFSDRASYWKIEKSIGRKRRRIEQISRRAQYTSSWGKRYRPNKCRPVLYVIIFRSTGFFNKNLVAVALTLSFLHVNYFYFARKIKKQYTAWVSSGVWYKSA